VTAKKSTLVEAPWWYRHVPRDFMSSPDVAMMTTEEIGSYFLLLQAAWLGGESCTLPNDLERLSKLARVNTLSEIVLSKFHKDKKGRLFNPRLRDEWEEALKRSEHGKNNATKRWKERMPRHSGADATALPSQCQPNATNTNTNTNKRKDQNRLHGAETVLQTVSHSMQITDAGADDDLVDKAKGIFLRIPLNDGSEYDVHVKAVADWEREFPGVDVRQEIRSTRAFWLARPIEQRKARHEIRQSLRAHLGKKQDAAGEPEEWEM
jgi:uncharacterized protein YdaU (DUF1376 family)